MINKYVSDMLATSYKQIFPNPMQTTAILQAGCQSIFLASVAHEVLQGIMAVEPWQEQDLLLVVEKPKFLVGIEFIIRQVILEVGPRFVEHFRVLNLSRDLMNIFYKVVLFLDDLCPSNKAFTTV